MWSTFTNSKMWSTRPSTLVGMDEEPYIAYCVDEAVATFGNYITAELEKVKGKNEKQIERKRHNRFLQLMDAPDEVRFRSLRPQAAKKKS